MSDVPSWVQVGPLRYDIIEDRALTDAANCWGRILHSKQTIHLDPEQSGDHKSITLVHELLHAVWRMSGITGLDDKEEQIITALAPTLTDALKRSAAFVAYVTEGRD